MRLQYAIQSESEKNESKFIHFLNMYGELGNANGIDRSIHAFRSQ